MIGAIAGLENSLAEVKEGFIKGFVTKDEYTDALRGYQKRQDDTMSDARDKAEAALNG